MGCRIIITVDVEAEGSQIMQDELTDIEAAVEETLTEYGHKHDLASAKIQ